MKDRSVTVHPCSLDMLTADLAAMDSNGETTRALDLTTVHREHGDFVWLSLQRLGAPESALDDLFQEVFVVVHRQIAGFEGRSKLTTWLFAICTRVVTAHRRRAHVRKEVAELDPQTPHDHPSPEQQVADEELRAQLQRILGAMDPTRRATLVMFELEGLSCEEIAEMTEVPLGTVYSRLHHARKEFVSCMGKEALRSIGRWRP